DLSAPGPRIQEPDIGNAQGQVVVNALQNLGHAIVFGKNLDAEEGRPPENQLGWIVALNHAHIRYAETIGLHLDTLLRDYADSPLLFAADQISDKKCL